MAFKDLRRILSERTRRQEETGLNAIEYRETERAKTLLLQLRTNYLIACRQRKEDWFKQHPDKQHFEETYEEFVRDCKLEEWIYYFIDRIFSRTLEQRYYDQKHPIYGWNHKSDIHTIEEPCKEGCRFWPEEGRIEDLEVLKDYEKYDRYDEVLKIWTEQQ